MKAADGAWIALVAGVIAWDTLGSETLSQAAARYKAARPALTCVAICYVAGHLMEWIPERIDFLSVLGKPLRAKGRRVPC